MVRQYKIHTDLDGSENKTYDMTNGIIRFYEPNDLGISMSTNVWSSQGMGVLGNSSISHPNLNFKLETFGSDLKENYTIFNKFINDIVSKKYVTLEYTNELGTFYADITLDNVTKTEGYGFDGTFSETIGFIPVNMWYQYEQLKFSKVENGEINGTTKIYGNKKLRDYPNVNLLEGTKYFSGVWNNASLWTDDGTYQGLNVRKRTEPQRGTYKIWVVPNDGTYTFSCYVKSTGSNAKVHGAFMVNGVRETDRTFGDNFDWKRDLLTRTLKAGDSIIYSYEMAGSAVDSTIWVAGYKIESGETATPWMPSESEMKSIDYPNLNLAQSTDMLVDENNNLVWGMKGNKTDSMTYEAVEIPSDRRIVNGVRVTQIESGQSGWRSPSNYSVNPYTEVGTNTQVTRSVYIKNNATTDLDISLTIGYSENSNGSSPKYSNSYQTVPANSDFILYKEVFNIPSTAKYIWFYVYTKNPTDSADFTFAGYKAEWGSVATPWMPSQSEVKVSDYKDFGSYKYDYTYYGEDNIERFSKWKIADGIFSFAARVVPSAVPTTPPTQSGKNYYGVRFLDKDFNEYTAIMFDSATKPESIQFNTDVNDEYYLAQFGTTIVNVFSALNYQRFRTRLIQKGTMELINVDVVEMNVKRKVEFV